MKGSYLEPVEHHGPSIAVKFYDDDLLLVGHGPLLKIYNYKTSEVLSSVRIFKKNKIHGIAFDRDTFIFYGGRSFNMVSLSQIMESRELIDNEKMINDWIITVEFSYNGLEAFLLTAHNVILSVDSYSQTLQWEKSVEGEKSILYSGSIRVASKHDVYINAGTVMGGVIVWNLYKEEVVHNLIGHEGSIFNVQMSENTNYIVSCSDDRSIKLWDFKTGELLSTAWGHTARIWNLKFYSEDNAVISVSEDLTSRTWTITEDKQLIPNETYQLHLGRHIWGLDVSKDGTHAATGGNDGRVRLFSIKPGQTEALTKNFTLSDIVSTTTDYKIKKNEIVKGFWRLNFGLVVITSEGGIFSYIGNTWKWIRTDSSFSNFSLTNGFVDQNIVIFTNSKGDSLLLKFDSEGNVTSENQIHTEVTKVVNALSTTDSGKIYLMIESPNTKEKLVVYEINETLSIEKTALLEKGPTFVTTCFEVVDDLIFVGFRLSSLGIYKLSTSEEIKFIKKLSISDTVTSIKSVQSDDEKLLLVIANRDGYYVYLKFDKATNLVEFVHSNNTRKGFLEGAFELDNELIVYGFKSSFFYIYNESREYEIAYENCGGAHRQWRLFQIGSGYQFVYTRSGTLTIRDIPEPAVDHFLSEGTHGREIRDISIRTKPLKGDKVLYVTGAEDTTLKLSTIDGTKGEIKNFWTLRKHTSGLQKVKFISDNLIASSAAREEFFVWKIDESFEVPLITPIASLTPSSDNPDLRIMDFDHLSVHDKDGNVSGLLITNVYSDSTIKAWYFDLSTAQFSPIFSGHYKTCCLLDVKLFIANNQVYLVTGATDGHLTLWDLTADLCFQVDEGKLILSEQLENKKLSPYLSNIAAHQNSIKSFGVRVTDSEVVVATGGDDNALAITTFNLEDGVSAEVKSVVESAASSTITSLKIISGDRLLVVSVDQIVRLWSFTENKLVLLDKLYTTIADTGSLDTVEADDREIALIGGVGLSVWDIKK